MSQRRDIPETRASLLSRLTYYWFTPFVYEACNKPLELPDLYNPPTDLHSQHLGELFYARWLTQPAGSPSALLNTLKSVFGTRFYWAGTLKAAADACALVSPFLISYFIRALSEDRSLCWKLALLVFVLQMVNTILVNAYFKVTMHIGLQARVSMATAIYSKVLRLSSRARSAASPGWVVNLISSDVSRIDQLAGFFHYLWSGPFQLIVIMIFMFSLIQWYAFVGLILLVLFIPIQARIMLHLGTLRRASSKIADERIKAILEFIRGIRVIKLYAWESSLLSRIAGLRVKELGVLRHAQLLKTGFHTLSMVVPLTACILTFSLYHWFGNAFRADIIFPALAYFNLLRLPLTLLPSVSNMFVDARVALRRIQDFLQLDESVMETEESGATDLNTALVIEGTFHWDTVKLKTSHKAHNGDVAVSSTTNLLSRLDSPESAAKRFTLDVNLEVPKGALIGIAGVTGAGKSSLLSAILCEMSTLTGRVQCQGRLGLCQQEAWIQQGSIKDNILFSRPLEETRYQQVLEASCLTSDLARFPDGDQTLIGEGGVNLSGGQKQRLAIARLLYSQPDIVLLDDPLSAVDVHVSKALFDRAIKQALSLSTRILVTHNEYALQECDVVYVMRDGRIIERISKGNRGENAAILGENGTPVTVESPSADILIPDSVFHPVALIEERAYGAVSSEVYWEYIVSAGGVPYILGVAVTIILLQTCRVMGDAWLSWWTIRRYPWSDGFYLAGYVGFGLAQACLVFINGSIFTMCGLRASKRLHELALRAVSNGPLSMFDKTPSGRIINRFAKDQDVVDNALSESLRSFLVMFTGSLASLVLMSVVTWQMLAVLAVLTLAYYHTQLRYRTTTRELKRLDALARSPLVAHMNETMSGVVTIRAFRAAPQFVTQNDILLDTHVSTLYALIMIQRWLAVRLEFVGNAIILSGMLSAAFFAAPDQAALVGLSLSYSLSITGMLNWCVRQLGEAESNIISSERLAEYAHNLPSETRHGQHPPKAWPSSGRIQFEGVTLRYAPLLPPALYQVNLDIIPGERIGVVGRTGAGKTSLLSALFRLVDDSLVEGSILIDDIDIRTLTLADLRSRLAIIPQDPLIFTGTIRSNLDPFNQHPDHTLWSALEHAYLKDAIRALPDGLDTPTTAQGDVLSMGQKQLLCLARALILQSKILVLDEATANVDHDTDRCIQSSIREHFSGCTILTIAHRINTIIDYDRVVVMEEGRVVECDSPDVLVVTPDSLFSSYVHS